MPIVILEVLLAVVELPQLPLLLLLKLHVHNSSWGCCCCCSSSCDAICWCGLLQLIPSSVFSSCSNTNCVLCTAWQCCLVYSLGLPIMLYLQSICIMHPRNYGHARSQGGRLPAEAKPPFRYHFIRTRCYIIAQSKANLTAKQTDVGGCKIMI